MKIKSIELSVSLDRDTFGQLEELGLRLNRSRGDVIRTALAEYLATNQATTKTRLITLAEYTSSALNVMMEENYPSRRKGLLDEVAQRLEAFHGIR